MKFDVQNCENPDVIQFWYQPSYCQNSDYFRIDDLFNWLKKINLSWKEDFKVYLNNLKAIYLWEYKIIISQQ